MTTPLLIDFALFTPDATNQALDLLMKARNDDESFIWQPHESVLIQQLVELFTKRGLMRLEAVRKAIMRWQNKTGAGEAQPSPLQVSMAQSMKGMMSRWTAEEKDLVEIYLNALPKDAWQLSDHMLCTELVVQTYLPHDEIVTEAQWLASKATMMGKVEANWNKAKQPTLADAKKLLAALPNNEEETVATLPLSPFEKTTLAFANFRAAENVVNLTDKVRKTLRSTIAQDVEKRQLGGDETGPSLQTKLFDSFSEFNRDWRRIAVTEAGECQLQGMIAGCKPGTKVKRIEQYASACPFCKKIHNTIATVVSNDHPNKDPDTMIWPGKNNIGRSGSPRKRVGDTLVKRTPDELWWLPAGLAHPHCRGRWVVVGEERPGDDPEFAKILAQILK